MGFKYNKNKRVIKKISVWDEFIEQCQEVIFKNIVSSIQKNLFLNLFTCKAVTNTWLYNDMFRTVRIAFHFFLSCVINHLKYWDWFNNWLPKIPIKNILVGKNLPTFFPVMKHPVSCFSMLYWFKILFYRSCTGK